MSLSTLPPLTIEEPGFIFWAPPGTALPLMVAAASTYDADPWPVAWINLGPTDEGSKLKYELKVEPLKVAELRDPIKYTTVERASSFMFAMANYTLSNVKRAFNGGTLVTVSGTGVTLSTKYSLPSPGAETRAMIGWESLDHTLRFVGYQGINSGTVESAFASAKYATLPCTFNFEVSPTVPQPVDFWAAGTGRLGI